MKRRRRRLVLCLSVFTLSFCIVHVLIPQMREGSLTGFRDSLMETKLEPYLNMLPLDSADDEEKVKVYKKDSDLPDHYAYYYDIIPENEKITYRELYVIMRDHLKFTKLSTKSEEDVSKVYQYVILDNPELYYVGTLQIETTKTAGSVVYIKACANELLNEKERKKANKEIEAFVNDFMKKIDNSWGNRKKARKAFEYIDEHAKYVKGANYNQSMYSVILGESVCMGYTATFKYLCDKMEIPCVSVTGRLGDTNHAWNMIKAKHLWYHVDCTQGDDMVTITDKVDFRWFCIELAELKKTHSLDEEEILPQAY